MGQLLDFTAYKLQEIANSLDNPQDIEVVLGILGDYYEGEVAIAWEHGMPVVMPLTEGFQSRGIPPGFSMVGYKQEELVESDEV
tara:strand:+ start:365 stop:616 length:252 start_codon:yes stop_codon:yes gene_type:complete